MTLRTLGTNVAALNNAYARSVVATSNADGLTDASTYLNGLITAASSAATTAFGTVAQVITLDGTYRCDARLQFKPNIIIDARKARVLKNYTDTGGTTASLVGNADWTTKCNNVTILGGAWASADKTTKKGNIFGWYGDDWTLVGTRVDGWSQGRAYAFVGDRARLERCVATGSTLVPGDGGIRVLGGADGMAIGCHIESGDDALQLVPAGGGSVASPQLFSQDIDRFQFIGCTGFSAQGRFMIVALQNRDISNLMTASIRNCSFANCKGSGGNHLSFYVQNYNSSGDIDGLEFIGDLTIGSDAQLASVDGQVSRHQDVRSDVGRIRGIRFTSFRFKTPRKTALLFRGGVENPVLDKCVIDAPQNSSITGVGLTSGSATITIPLSPPDPVNGFINPQPLSGTDVGASITGTGIPTNTTVTAVADDGLSATISNNATATNANATVLVGGTHTLNLTGTVNPIVSQSVLQGGGNGHVIHAGGDDKTGSGYTVPQSVFDMTLMNNYLFDIPTAFYGVNAQKVINGLIFGNKFIEVSGAAAAHGLRINSQSSGIVYAYNRLTGISTSGNRVTDNASDTVWSKNAGVADSVASTANVQVFAASGTWTKPTGAVTCQITAIGPGGGGGSGALLATSTAGAGGGGGGGGGITTRTVAASLMGSTETVTLGTPGTGGAAQSTNSTAGNAGGNGTSTLVGAHVKAGGGVGGGGGGIGAAGTAGTAGSGTSVGGAGATAASGAAGSTGTSGQGAPGGGSGGGITGANAATAGGNGGLPASNNISAATGGANTGAVGGNGTAATANEASPGGSGAGGGANIGGNGGAGGNGALYGAGGGGGGAAQNGNSSGKGGDGAAGMVVVTSW